MPEPIDPHAAGRIAMLADSLDGIGIAPEDLAGALLSEGAARLMAAHGRGHTAQVLAGLAERIKEAADGD